MSISIKDSVLFVTGASRKNGIGQALVKEAIRRGAKKVYATARDTSKLEDLAKNFQGIIVPIELDVTNKDQIEEVARMRMASDTNILINNAGYCGFSSCVNNCKVEESQKEMAQTCGDLFTSHMPFQRY